MELKTEPEYFLVSSLCVADLIPRDYWLMASRYVKFIWIVFFTFSFLLSSSKVFTIIFKLSNLYTITGLCSLVVLIHSSTSLVTSPRVFFFCLPLPHSGYNYNSRLVIFTLLQFHYSAVTYVRLSPLSLLFSRYIPPPLFPPLSVLCKEIERESPEIT